MDAYDYLPVVHSGNSFLERQASGQGSDRSFAEPLSVTETTLSVSASPASRVNKLGTAHFEPIPRAAIRLSVRTGGVGASPLR